MMTAIRGFAWSLVMVTGLQLQTVHAMRRGCRARLSCRRIGTQAAGSLLIALVSGEVDWIERVISARHTCIP